MSTATLIGIESLPDQEKSHVLVQAYTYTLDPPAEWEGVMLHTITIRVQHGSTCVFNEQGQRLQCRDRLGGRIEPDEFLSAFCGYEETFVSKLRRLVGVIEPPAPPTMTNYVSYAFRDIWPHLSDDARLIVTAIVRGADLAVANEKQRAEWRGAYEEDSEGSDTGDGSIMEELRAIRKLLEARL